jgi:hypothetical protein
MNTKRILSLLFMVVSLALLLFGTFFWKDPGEGLFLTLAHFVSGNLIFLAMGVDGLLQSRREKRERGYTYLHYTPWLLIGLFLVLLVLQLTELLS